MNNSTETIGEAESDRDAVVITTREYADIVN